MMEEDAVLITGYLCYQDRFYVNSEGMVWNSITNTVLPERDNGNGYKKVYLNGEGAQGGVQLYVHRIVAQAFLPNPDNLPQVGHKDHNKANNKLANLYWTTQSQNTKDGVSAGRINNKKRGKTNQLTKEDIDKIAKLESQGLGPTDIGKQLGFPRTTISSVLNGRSSKQYYESRRLHYKNTTDP